MSANRENIEAHVLAAVGAVKGVYEVYKPTDSIEKAEAIGLVIGIGGMALCGYLAIKSLKENAPFITMER